MNTLAANLRRAYVVCHLCKETFTTPAAHKRRICPECHRGMCRSGAIGLLCIGLGLAAGIGLWVAA